MVIRKTTKKKNIKTIINGGGFFKKKSIKERAAEQLKQKELISTNYKPQNTKKQKNSWTRKGVGLISQGIAAVPAAVFALGKARIRHVELKKTIKTLEAQKKDLLSQKDTNSKLITQPQINAITKKIKDIESQQKKSSWQKYKNAYKNEMGKAYSQGVIKYALSTPGKALRTASSLLTLPYLGGRQLRRIPILKQLTSNKFLKTISSAPALKRYTGRILSNIGKRTKERFKKIGKKIYYGTRGIRGYNPFALKMSSSGVHLKGSKLAEFIKADQKRFDKLKTNAELENKKIEQNKLRLAELEMKPFKTSRENDEIANLKTDIAYRTQKIINYKGLMTTLKNDIDFNLKNTVGFLKNGYDSSIRKNETYIKNNYAITKSHLLGIKSEDYNIDSTKLDNFKKLFEDNNSFDFSNPKDTIETARLLYEAEKDPTKKIHFKNLYSKLYDLNYKKTKQSDMEAYKVALEKFSEDYETVGKIRKDTGENTQKMKTYGSSAFIGYSGLDNKSRSQKIQNLQKEIEAEKQTREVIEKKRELIMKSWKSNGLSSNRINRVSAFLQNYDFMKWTNTTTTKINLDTPSNVVDAFKNYIKEKRDLQ
jgi:hypothetical protein